MSTKIIKNTDTNLFLDVSSGSKEALRELTKQSDDVTATATNILSKVDVKTLESLLTSEDILVKE